MPAGIAGRRGHSNGNHSNTASGLPGIPRGSSNQNAPTNAITNASALGSGSQTKAPGQCAAYSSTHHNASIACAASCRIGAPTLGSSRSTPSPINDNGTTTRLNHGMPIRLVSGETSEACPKNQTVSGSRPSVATPCAPKNNRRRPRGASCGRHHNSHATPANDNQNPAASIASGSTINIAASANASAVGTDDGRRHKRAASAAAIISRVRTVGSSKPASAV